MQGQRIIFGLGAIWGLIGLALLAAGSHPPAASLLAQAGQVLLFHAVAVIAVVNTQLVSGWRRAAPLALMLAGSGLFALVISLHVLSGVASFALLTPVGGGLALIGWLILAVGAFIEPKA